MKIAVIDHIGNPGGSIRVLRSLLPAFKALRPDIDITFFGDSVCIERENLGEEFTAVGVKLKVLNATRLASRGILGIKDTSYLCRTVQMKYAERLSFLPTFLSGAVHKEIEKVVKGFDLAFFPWPYLAKCPQLDCPMVGIFHDFNFRYYFSGFFTLSRWQLDLLNREMPVWLQRCTPVVSTAFMAGELGRFYPEYADKVRVVHLASMSTLSNITNMEARQMVSDLGVKNNYILYPTNLCSHKNLGPLLAAIPVIKNRGHKISLVLTGPQTDMIRGHACDIGVELGTKDVDVIGLGYVTNLQMDSLIQCATAVVSTSLYEAGNGPGLDAWARGVPVAMSNIPAFLEHTEVQDVRAEIFDPRSPQDIADKILNLLSNYEKAKADALHSQEALNKVSWLQTAEKYLSIFEEAINGGTT